MLSSPKLADVYFTSITLGTGMAVFVCGLALQLQHPHFLQALASELLKYTYLH